MEIISLSIVASPANGVAIEKAQEIKNATRFVKAGVANDKQGPDVGELDIFNN